MRSAAVSLLLIVILGMSAAPVGEAQEQPQQAKRTEESKTAHQEDEHGKSFWKRTTDDPVAFFTGVLVLIAVSQAALFVWQLLYMRQGMADAKTAAEAARDAAKAAGEQAKTASAEFISTHRPRIIVRNFRVMPVFMGQKEREVEFIYINIGETEATQITLIGEVFISHDVTVVARDRDMVPWPIKKNLLACGEVGTAKIRCPFELGGWQVEAIEDGKAEIYCVGVISYTDGRGILRRTGFARRHHPESARFHRIEDDEYEYSY